MKFNRSAIDSLSIQLQDATDEMRRRLFARRPCGAAEMLGEYPQLSGDRELAVRLVHAEWVARLEMGENPSISQWL